MLDAQQLVLFAQLKYDFPPFDRNYGGVAQGPLHPASIFMAVPRKVGSRCIVDLS